MHRICIAHATDLLLDNLPASVESFGLPATPIAEANGHPDPYNPYGIEDWMLQADILSRLPLSPANHQIQSRGQQLQRLKLDISHIAHFTLPGPSGEPPKLVNLAYWRKLLQQMVHLRELELTHVYDDYNFEWAMGDKYHLINILNGVVLPNLVKLRLQNWYATDALLAEKVHVTFPNLQRLELINIRFRVHVFAGGAVLWEEQWVNGLAGLLASYDGSLKVTVRKPKEDQRTTSEHSRVQSVSDGTLKAIERLLRSQ